MPDLAELNARADRWTTRRQLLEETTQEGETELAAVRQDLSDIKGAVALLQYVSTETSKANEDQTAMIVSHALRDTFTDQQLSLKVEHGNYRGHPGVVFKLRDEAGNIEGDPMDSFGGGPASLIGLVLQVLSVVRQPGMSHVLVLDEPLSQVSAGYQAAAGRILRKLCEPPPHGSGFKMLVVTHMESIADAAHKRYRATKSEDGKSLVLTEEREESASIPMP
jgi:DNA repair ATPase RecN